jgi:hypothetical protein
MWQKPNTRKEIQHMQPVIIDGLWANSVLQKSATVQFSLSQSRGPSKYYKIQN